MIYKSPFKFIGTHIAFQSQTPAQYSLNPNSEAAHVQLQNCHSPQNHQHQIQHSNLTSSYSEKQSMTSNIEIGDTLSNSVICRRITIVGNAYSEGDVLIEGNFEGDIQAASIRVGPLAQVEGNFKAKEVFVSGQVEGTVIGGRVVLDKDAYVEGDIYHESLSIEDGAIFKGKSYQARYDGVGASAPSAPTATKPASSIAPSTTPSTSPSSNASNHAS